MFWNSLKTVGGLMAGCAAAKVTTNIIKEFTTRRMGVIFTPTGEGSKIVTLNIKQNSVEKAVMAVGTFVIASAVGTYVAKNVSQEIQEVEDLVKSLRADTDAAVEKAKHGYTVDYSKIK